MQESLKTEMAAIWSTIPLREEQTVSGILERLDTEAERYFSNGVHSVEDELDFCSILALILDEETIVNQNVRTKLLNEMYEATGFERFYQG